MPLAVQQQPQIFLGDPRERLILRQVARRFRRRFGERFQGRLDIAPGDDRRTHRQLLPEDVQEAFEVRPHVLETDAGGGHDRTYPAEVIGEESRAGGQDGGREVGEVELGILDALLTTMFSVATLKLGVHRVLPLDDGSRERLTAGVDGSADGDIGVIHGN